LTAKSGVGAKINELNAAIERPASPVRHTGFNAGGEVWRPDQIYKRSHPQKTNRNMFSNAKAQAWWHVADMLRDTYNAVQAFKETGLPFAGDPSDLLFIDGGMPNLSKLVDELCTPKRDFDNTGKVKVESKKDLARSNREGGPVPSPNLAEAFVMAYAPVRRTMAISAEALEAA
jgi:phage terminase large subunit